MRGADRFPLNVLYGNLGFGFDLSTSQLFFIPVVTMKGAHLVNDGLWRCLCPSWERAVLSRAVWRPRLMPRPATRSRASEQQRYFGVDALEVPVTRPRRAQQDALPTPPARSGNSRHHAPTDSGTQRIDEVLLAPTPPTPEKLDNQPLDVIVGALKRLRTPGGYQVNPGQDCDRYERILLLVRRLIARGHPKDSFVYECLVDAMADPKGSAKNLRKLLQEMEEVGIHPSAQICRSASAALAVHPSYALRQQVEDTIESFWHTALPKENTLVAMLREGQHELAYDKLMSMLESGQEQPLWLYDIFVLEFGNQGFLDEMLSLLVRRKQSKLAKARDEVATALTYYCLDICSRALHHQGTSYAWNICVKEGVLNPSDGMLENVLATASREGDVSLAAEVHGIISERKRVQIHHYDALTEAFVNNGDIKGAIRILAIMKQSGLSVLRESTRSLYDALLSNPQLLESAHNVLLESAKKDQIPLGVLSVVLEVASKSGQNATARSLYESCEALTGQKPSAQMIEDMIINSTGPKRPYFDDYKSTIPDDHKPMGRLAPAYTKLIHQCLDCEEWDLAIRFAEGSFLEYRGYSQHHAPIWLNRLTTLAVENQIKGIWRVYDECVRGGNHVAARLIRNVAQRVREQAVGVDQYEASLRADPAVEEARRQTQGEQRPSSTL